MKNKILSYLLGGFFAVLLGFGGLGLNSVEAVDCTDPCDDGIKLNTCFPIIGNCINTGSGKTRPTEAFPTMIGALTKIIIALVFVICFILIIVAGIMRAGAGEDSSKKTKAKKLIIKVGITVLLLGFSGVILRLINPNFFGGWTIF